MPMSVKSIFSIIPHRASVIVVNEADIMHIATAISERFPVHTTYRSDSHQQPHRLQKKGFGR